MVNEEILLMEIDYRETNKEFNNALIYYTNTIEKFYEFHVKKTDLKIDQVELKIADVLFGKRVPIERKTTTDLLDSIYRKGRLNNQCKKMKDNYDCGAIVVSGNISDYNEFQQKQVISIRSYILKAYNIPIYFCGNESNAAYQSIAIAYSFYKDSKPQIILDIPKGLTIFQQKEGILSMFDGVRKVKRQALIDEFKSLYKIFNSSIEELMKVFGIGKKIATNMYEVIHDESIKEKEIEEIEEI